MNFQTIPQTAAEGPALIVLSVRDTAQMLDLGESTVWKLIRQGKLRVSRIGARTLVLRESIDELLASNVA